MNFELDVADALESPVFLTVEVRFDKGVQQYRGVGVSAKIVIKAHFEWQPVRADVVPGSWHGSGHHPSLIGWRAQIVEVKFPSHTLL
jgi:hypothetical protein